MHTLIKAMQFSVKHLSRKSIFLTLQLVVIIALGHEDIQHKGRDLENTQIHAIQAPKETAEISLDFQDIAVRVVLQQLAKLLGLNMMIDEQIQGHLSLHLDKLPATQALAMILQMQGLEKQQLGHTWIIVPQGTLLARQKAAQDIQHQHHALEALQSKRIRLRYREAKDIAELFLGKNPSKSDSRGQLSVDTRSNSLWIQDTQRRIQDLAALVQAFDQPVQQVLIEARIVNIDRGFEQELGIRFGVNPVPQLNSHLDDTSQIATRTMPSDTPLSQRFNVDLPVRTSGNPVSLGLALLNLGKNHLLDLELSALESAGGGHIISSPHLMTTDRTPAIIEAGSEIPYQERSKNGGTSVAFKKAVLSLKVTPQILDQHHILLQLQVNHDKPSTLQIQETPAIDTRALQTQVIVASGETIVLGGIYERLAQKTVRRIPFVSKIPLIGAFFSHRIEQTKTKDLFIFVTPRILPAAPKKSLPVQILPHK